MPKKRMMGLLSVLLLVFGVLIVHLGMVTRNRIDSAVANGHGVRTTEVIRVRGTIYDRHIRPMVNAESEYRATLLPQERLLAAIRSAVDPSHYMSLLESATEGSPLLVRLTGPVAITEGLRLFFVPVRYSSYVPSVHLIGYLDGGGQRGVAGLECAYDEYLSACSGEISVSYAVNGAGHYMAGQQTIIENSTGNAAGGILLSIDRDIQKIVDTVCVEKLVKGAVVLLDPHTGAVLANASYPTYHPDRLADTMKTDDGALLNRTLGLYDCGSVFKIVTAAAALENGIPLERSYVCDGAMAVGSTVFHCHERRLGHGSLALEEAFAQSCNLYFIQLAQEVGAENLLEMAHRLGLSDAISLADTIKAPRCLLPTVEELYAPAALANMSFGQGKLLLTPLHVARLTATLVNDGILVTPYLVNGLVDQNKKMIYEKPKREGERILSEQTAVYLRRMMEQVVANGTGKQAQLDGGISSAGKTGTAQTGQYNHGIPVVQSWFTGYFPADDPKYVITVLAEDADTTHNNATRIFCEISNKLMEWERGS